MGNPEDVTEKKRLEEALRQKTEELKQANRRLTVEAALERVRAAALGMKSSEDLSQTATTLFQELKGLALPIWRGGFAIVNEASDPPALEMWGLTARGTIIRGVQLPFALHPVMQEVYAAWKRQDDTYPVELTGDAVKNFHQYLQEMGYPTEWPDQWMTYRNYPALFTYGLLYIVTPDRLSEDDLNALRRFRDVFAFAYTRFLDLQQAEARAREAARQAAVDRVRAEVAAMRTSADLERVTPLLWKELTGLGVPFFRCGVYIVDEEAGQTHLYLTNPQGESLAALSLPFDCHPLVRGAVDHWRRGEVFVDRWDREAFVAWMGFLEGQGLVIDRERYQGAEAPPESLVFQLVPFVQGMLYVGSAEALPEEDIALMKSLTNAFSVAYARYQDFQKLEAQNRVLEKALDEKEKAQEMLVRSESMAAIGTLVAGVAHELNNPLGAASSLVQSVQEMIQEDSIEEFQQDREAILNHLAFSRKEMGRIKDIVASLLDLSRQTNDYTEPVKLSVVAKDALRVLYNNISGMR